MLRTICKYTSFRNCSNVQCMSYSQARLKEVKLLETTYESDDFTNVTEKIISHIGKNLHKKEGHPLSNVRQRIVNYFYKSFVNSRGNPVFSVYDNLNPIVSVTQNFDSLLIPKDHVSRSKSDCYYLNRDYLLRAHMTAHQCELIQSGLNNFLMVGDVYRRDEIDRTHYPVFHQLDAVRLKTKDQLFNEKKDLQIFEEGNNTVNTGNQEKQACHSLEAVMLMEYELKSTLVGLAKTLFGEKTEYRWVDAYFPFTQPSWELEVKHDGEWLELLGCGIMRQGILKNSGINDRIGWAFGLGLERVAMCIHKIPDIRLFWSNDSGFLNQFNVGDINKNVIYKAISQFPQCKNDISFWLPEGVEFASNDFYDLVRSIGGDLIEQVTLVDNFKHPKTGKTSHCYRIIYRHMEKTLTQSEVNDVHKQIENAAKNLLNVTIR
ncbi:probable phenylalanine--tRNA ligase, mitochondrial [Aethina tumida]|uniref:probable phenylalanine--tRNA ligase, mitochondrial n=1 Tax=Aethina tumida TaxID=116153 RepID=UPI00096B1ACA|nr:probable phenylalanine--tRNA ligase, mitochondrial [Aethina tumida]